MEKIIKARTAGIITLGIFALLIVFHILVLSHVVPSDLVWAGEVSEDPYDLLVLELTVILLILLFGMVLLLKLRLIAQRKSGRAINIGIWIIFAYFIINTISNLSRGITTESLIFAPVSLILVLLILRLAIEKEVS